MSGSLVGFGVTLCGLLLLCVEILVVGGVNSGECVGVTCSKLAAKSGGHQTLSIPCRSRAKEIEASLNFAEW